MLIFKEILNLRPETGYKGSLGIRYKLNPTSNINFNAFLENIDDPLGWRYEHNKFHAVNFENQKKRGFQLEYNKNFQSKIRYVACLYSYNHTY